MKKQKNPNLWRNRKKSCENGKKSWKNGGKS